MGKKDITSNLYALFHPDAVAVIGASENESKLGFHVMKSLTQGSFSGRIMPINPGAKKIMGLRAYPAVGDCEEPVDLAIIVVPARWVPGIFEECAKKGVRGIVLITAGFKEIEDAAGGENQKHIADLANRAAIPVIGPNTFGMVNLHRDLNATFTPEFSGVGKGAISLVSQSGGAAHLLSFMAMRENVRMSKIIGLGNRLNVDFAQILPFLVEDPDTRVIALYLEGLDDPRKLKETAEAFRGRKPVIAFKTGESEVGDRASQSHTGSLAGKHEIYWGALKQAGIFPTKDFHSLLDLAKTLAVCPFPQNNGVAVLTAQAGPGMAACDVCEREGLEIVQFSTETQATVNGLLPPLALRTNPIDLGPAWYDSDALRGIIQAVMDDDAVASIILIMMFASANRMIVPNLMPLLLDWQQKKPVVTCLVAPPGIWDEHVMALEEAGAIVNIPTPERAAKAMAALYRYAKMING
jgi:acyl-CoA synthetase (NDP forming)